MCIPLCNVIDGNVMLYTVAAAIIYVIAGVVVCITAGVGIDSDLFLTDTFFFCCWSQYLYTSSQRGPICLSYVNMIPRYIYIIQRIFHMSVTFRSQTNTIISIGPQESNHLLRDVASFCLYYILRAIQK